MIPRPAEARDADALATMYLASRRRHVPFAPLAHSEPEVRSWMRDVLVPSGNIWLLSDGTAVVGFIAMSVSPEESWIDQLYVDPDRTGQGHGSRLLAFALQRLPAPVFLFTFQQNAGARRFYERAGFVAEAFSDGSQNEERCPDVRYRRG